MLLTEQERNEYAEKNIKLVYYVAKNYQFTGVMQDELNSAGMVGYAKALKNFDKERDVQFSTYAINCIKNEILFFLRKEKLNLKNTISMNTILASDKNGNNLSLEDTLSDRGKAGVQSIDEHLSHIDNVDILKKLLKELTTKERYIIIYRFGLDRGIIKTQKEIAKDVQMSQANISKSERNILSKLNSLLRGNKVCNREIKSATRK